MSGHGNDFIIVDNSHGNIPMDWEKCAPVWCSNHLSIGADGLLVLEPSRIADFVLRIFNSDGSEAEMCGNGTRCAASFVAKRMSTGSSMVFETMAGVVKAYVMGKTAYVQLTEPSELHKGITLNTGATKLMVYTINTGVPHAILFKDHVSEMSPDELARLGKFVRYHEAFQPEGINVNFVEVMGPGLIRVRTYERGVEAETMACGTGAAASAILSHIVRGTGGPPFHVQMPGGVLKIDFTKNDAVFGDVWLAGEVSWIYDGEIRGEV